MRILATIFAATLLTPPGQAPGPEPSAAHKPSQSAAERAARHFAAEQWDEAIVALTQAYAEDPDPDYLYARAQAERFSGRCAIALDLYRRFLDSDPSPEGRADTENHIRTCEAIVADAQVDSQPTPAPEPGTAPQEAPPRFAPDGWGVGLITASAVVSAAGAATWIVGAQARREAPRGATDDSYTRDANRGRTLTAVGIGAVSMGVALLVAGATRLALVAKRKRDRRQARHRRRY